MFRYADIERAIAQMNEIPPEAMASFRGRVRNFQRIGLVKRSSGVGQKVEWTADDAVYLAAIFELSQAGIPPSTIKAILGKHPDFLWWFPAAEADDSDRFLFVGGSLMKPFAKAEQADEIAVDTGTAEDVLAALKRPGNARLVVINLSVLLTRLAEHLKDV